MRAEIEAAAMSDLRTFHRHHAKTHAAIRKLVERFEPHARYRSRDPVELSLDELREILLTLSRCETLLVQAIELLQRQQAECEP
jgi:hypothetical protein